MHIDWGKTILLNFAKNNPPSTNVASIVLRMKSLFLAELFRNHPVVFFGHIFQQQAILTSKIQAGTISLQNIFLSLYEEREKKREGIGWLQHGTQMIVED